MGAKKTNIKEFAYLLEDVERGLRDLDWWQEIPLSETDLVSDLPFSMDILAPEQWLQFIFIPKIRGIIENDGILPCSFSLSPYFEEVWKNRTSTASLLFTIRQIDRFTACHSVL